MQYDENEEEPLTSPDTPNRTRLNPSEGKSPSQDYGPGKYWERLSRLNTGVVDSFGTADTKHQRRQERLAAFDAVAGQLELTSWQKREGRRIMETLRVGSGGLGIDLYLASFTLAAYVVREDSASTRTYHPRRADRNNCRLFLDVANDLGLDPNRIHSVLNRMEEHVSEY